MAVRLKHFDNSRESYLLLAMISSTDALAQIAQRWERQAFSAPSSVALAKECLAYYARYGEAPSRLIDNLVRGWDEEKAGRELIEACEMQLAGLRDSYRAAEPVNLLHVLDLYNKQCREQKLCQLSNDLRDCIDVNNFDEAEARVSDYLSTAQVSDSEGSEDVPLNDANVRRLVHEKDSFEPIINYPGPLGLFFNKTMRRANFVAFIAAEGTGKSFWLLDAVYRALLERRKVAYFELGDMGREQVLTRLNVRMEGKPEELCTVRYPYEYSKATAPVRKARKFTSCISAMGFDQAADRMISTFIKSKTPYLRLYCYPAGALAVSMIEAKLKKLERLSQWVPDVIVIDYSDLLAPPQGLFREPRDQIAESWKQLRALSTRLHCLLLTATQCNREGYDAKLGLRMRHISEEKRKVSHVTHMVGINQTDAEKAVEVQRLNFLKARNMRFRPGRFVYCAGCLALGQPAVLSLFPKQNVEATLVPKRKTKKK